MGQVMLGDARFLRVVVCSEQFHQVMLYGVLHDGLTGLLHFLFFYHHNHGVPATLTTGQLFGPYGPKTPCRTPNFSTSLWGKRSSPAGRSILPLHHGPGRRSPRVHPALVFRNTYGPLRCPRAEPVPRRCRVGAAETIDRSDPRQGLEIKFRTGQADGAISSLRRLRFRVTIALFGSWGDGRSARRLYFRVRWGVGEGQTSETSETRETSFGRAEEGDTGDI